ncbi:MAG: cytochrome b N-terminal domain-containing protein [Dermatophilaceae bacterium]
MSVLGAVFLDWWVFRISFANLLVIVVMIALFLTAILVRLPGSGGPAEPADVPVPSSDPTPSVGGNWTTALRGRLQRVVPQGQVLPDRQPAYVQSGIYVFGVLTFAALIVVIGTGVILALKGSLWWHTSSVGHFVNSTHLWSVQLFFVAMVIHLWGQFFMEGWRGKRAMTWVTGALAFFGSIGTAFTGYLSQANFESQWISTQAKDGLNAAGVGAFFNVLDGSQMLLWHVSLLPLLVGIIAVMHIVLVRRHGVVPPIDAEDDLLEPCPAPTANQAQHVEATS